MLRERDNFIVIRKCKDRNYLTVIDLFMRFEGSVILYAEKRFLMKVLRIITKAKELGARIALYKLTNNGGLLVVLKSEAKPNEREYILS